MPIRSRRRPAQSNAAFDPQPSGGGGSLDADTTLWVAAVVTNGGTVSTPRQTLVDDLIVDLKAAGLWTITDRLWILAAENAATAQVDLKARANFTLVNAPSFSADHGYAGNGTTSYIDTSFTPSTAGGNFSQDAASLMYYGLTDDTTGGFASAIGGVNFASYICPMFASTIFSSINAGGASMSVANSTAIGAYVSTRTGSAASALYKNGSSTPITTSATTSDTTTSSTIGICCGNGGGAQFSTIQVAAAWIGGGLTGAQAAALMNLVNAYMAGLPSPVDVY